MFRLRLRVRVGRRGIQGQAACDVVDVGLDAVDRASRPLWITVKLFGPRKLNWNFFQIW